MKKKNALTVKVADEKKETAIQIAINERSQAEVLIRQAIDKNVPVETMEKLLAMRREMKAEYAKAQYDAAMAAFQAECPTIKKTKEVKTKAGIVAYRYAPIESIVEQVKPALQKHGFSYSTRMELMPAGVKAVVRVTHEAGHSEESPMEVPFGTKTDIMSQSQVAAAASTFAKRYAFLNAFGILTGDEDNDARPMEKAAKPSKDEMQLAGKAKAIILKTDNSKQLQQMRLQIENSKLYSKGVKQQLMSTIDEKLEVIGKTNTA